MDALLQQYGLFEQGTVNWGMADTRYRSMAETANRDQQRFMKALVTGSGVVQPLATGGQTLRVQYLHDILENTSFAMEHCVLMRLIPKDKAWSNTIEYSTVDYPGQGGDGFTDETGSDGAFGVDYADDNFKRQVEIVKYMASARQVGLVEQEVRNLADPMAIEKDLAIRDLISKAELAGYFGNAGFNSSSWNGIEAQVEAWVMQYPFDTDILYDMGGQPLDKAALELIAILNLNKWGRGDLLIQSATSYGNSNILLFPEVRDGEGNRNARFGSQKKVFDGPNGDIRIEKAPMLRPGRPLRPDGPGSDGRARLTATSGSMFGPDALAVSFASNPFVAVSGANGTQAVTPGSGLFMQNKNLNTDSGILSTLPSLPSGGTNQNRLAAGTYYFGVAPVWRGREGPLYIYGAGSQSTVKISGTPTAITVTQGQAVQIDFDNATPAITGLGTTYGRSNVYYRIYRFGGPGASAPVNVSDFQFLENCGIPTSGNSRYVDNGYKMPGTDTNFLISTEVQGRRGWSLLQLLPLMRRLGLPELPLASPLVMLWFATPILWRRRQHVVIRNIGGI